MSLSRTIKIGLVVNPFAGIGGALALKGSDGADIRTQALAAGAEQLANDKTQRALAKIADLNTQIEIFTAAGDMGQSVCQALSLPHQVIYHPAHTQTEGKDTEAAIDALLAIQPDLVVFAGGDGTARNVCQVLGDKIPVVGIPAGCKIHSGVFAVTPTAAGDLLREIVSGQLLNERQCEVRDIDESAFRDGKVIAKHFGEMRVPDSLQYIQAVKMGGKESDELLLNDIGEYIQELIDDEPDTHFVMGSGSTVASIMAQMGLPNTLLGVDVVKDGELVLADATAAQLLALAATGTVKVVLTLIGGQGHLLGRGNQQLSPALINKIGKDNLLVVATKNKILSLHDQPMRLDSGDEALDRQLAGLFSIICGYQEKVLYPAQ